MITIYLNVCRLVYIKPENFEKTSDNYSKELCYSKENRKRHNNSAY